MALTIVEYNGHHVRLGSPLDARLRKQDENYRVAVYDRDDEGHLVRRPVDEITLPIIDGDEKSDGDEAVDYSKLKVTGEGGIDELLEQRNIDASSASNKDEKIALLVAADEAEGEVLS